MKKTFDIVIVGAGIVGMAFALDIAKRTNFNIALLETSAVSHTWHEDTISNRVSALSLASSDYFSCFHVWQDIAAKRVSEFTGMHVWQETEKAELRFDSAEIAESCLGHIVENNLIQVELEKKLKHFSNISLLRDVKLKSYHDTYLLDENNHEYHADVFIAADGANSWLRHAAGISVQKKLYDQKAIVATVETSLSHQKIARQVFLSGGPLAFLPLKDENMCSIVWSLLNAKADVLLNMPDEAFAAQLAQAFSHCLGEVTYVGERNAFPLYEQLSNQYISKNIALIGDAAHTIHPLAGQGLNIGLQDAMSLANSLVKAYEQDEKMNNQRLLRRYQRARNAENALLLNSIDWLKRFFENDSTIKNTFRNAGIDFIEKTACVKNIIMRYAVNKAT